MESEVKAELDGCTARRAELTAARAVKAAELPAAALRRYEQICAARGGSPLASVIGSLGSGQVTCGECHMTLRPQVIVELHKQEELVPCESCGRILFLEVQPSAISQNG